MTHRIVCSLYDGFDLLELAEPIAPFEVCRRLGRFDYEISYASLNPGKVTSSENAVLLCSGLPALEDDFTLILPGSWDVFEDASFTPLLSWIRSVADSGKRIVAIGSGVRILARTGILDGRSAVCHWYVAPMFSQEFPLIQFDSKHLFARDGNIWTCAGGSTGIDTSLSVIREDCGNAAIREITKMMVIFSHRAGHHLQSPMNENLVPRTDRFEELLAWIQERLDESLYIERLSEQMGMSTRNFSRCFKAEFGLPPAKAIEKLRVQAACHAIRSGISMDNVAQLTGFENTVRMHRSFLRILGMSPREFIRSAKTHASISP